MATFIEVSRRAHINLYKESISDFMSTAIHRITEMFRKNIAREIGGSMSKNLTTLKDEYFVNPNVSLNLINIPR